MKTKTLCVLTLLAGACDRQALDVSHPATGTETFALTADWPVFAQGGSASAKLDILFMIDNSVSISAVQAKLEAGFHELMTAIDSLPGGAPDFHIGVVSSDLGAGAYDIGDIPQCRHGGDQGILQSIARGSTCATGTLNAGETFISNSNGQKNYTGDLPSVFSCIAALGDQGCGFEHVFGSVQRALGIDGWGGTPMENAGFLRDDAFLAVILVTNEDDCSAPIDSMLFDPLSRFVSDPLGPLSSFRCNQFGHVCTAGGKRVHPSASTTGVLMSCASAEDGKLVKVSEFVNSLKTLKKDPAHVFLAAVAGPPTPYAVDLFPPTLTGDPSMWPSVRHSCTSNDGTFADPSVRIAQAVAAFGSHGLFSTICGDTMGPILHEIASRFTRPLDAPCIPTPSPVGPGCTVVDRWVDDAGMRQAARLPACAGGVNAVDGGASTMPCWELVTDQATCGATEQHLRVQRGGAAVPQNLMTAIDCSAAHP